ncbi:DGQHR domain-containing protein [Bradyrhizobium sp. USDA 3315]
MKGWENIDFSEAEHRRKPKPYFYLFALSAAELRGLCGIARRHTSALTPRAADLGIQRQHDPERSNEIGRFVEFGFPWSTLSEAKRASKEFNDLRKPGWLPTAIVLNILLPEDVRGKDTVSSQDIVKVEDGKQGCHIQLPYSPDSKDWRPSTLPPLEIIDGQHRLWAFDNESDTKFELPVVAFHGLDISWQAYLFWTINIKPKRINSSLAFDLYPLLRAQDWLDRAEGHSIYRETRSQELAESLWSHPESPWYDRINMLGESRTPWVSQAAWIRTLMATFVRSWEARGGGPGGLFGSRMNDDDEVLDWSRAQQAAFLIFAWKEFQESVKSSQQGWVKSLRLHDPKKNDSELASDELPFYGPFSLIATDQGVRGFTHVLNDVCFANATKLQLRSWQLKERAAATDANGVASALKSLTKHPLAKFLSSFSSAMSSFDWRTSAAPDLSDKQRRDKAVFRGSGGYKEIRLQLLEHLAKQTGELAAVSKRLLDAS